jgi:hypothetical protein
VKVILAGLDGGHLKSATNGYSMAAGEYGEVLVSFFFYVDPSSHAGRSTQLIPDNKESNDN